MTLAMFVVHVADTVREFERETLRRRTIEGPVNWSLDRNKEDWWLELHAYQVIQELTRLHPEIAAGTGHIPTQEVQ